MQYIRKYRSFERIGFSFRAACHKRSALVFIFQKSNNGRKSIYGYNPGGDAIQV